MAETLAEIDEALAHTALVPPDSRGDGWFAWVDALLDQRQQAELEHQWTLGTESSSPNTH